MSMALKTELKNDSVALMYPQKKNSKKVTDTVTKKKLRQRYTIEQTIQQRKLKCLTEFQIPI